MDFSRVIEKTREPYFIVKHKLLSVPKEDYEKILKDYLTPYSEEGVQEFVRLYLKSKGEQGIVGLVGLEKQGEKVFIDAAIRYKNRKD